MEYGFQRLVLLGSAGYSRAELPLDDSVSLVAPNNRGKTSLINALQYLLIIDRRRMDFGAHDADKSRRFYFPNNSAYILLEVALPEVGTVVLGCVGKGVSFDYEYFAYSGSLNIDEYRLPGGNLVAQPQLAAHLASFGRMVRSYNSAEFADMVYGKRNQKISAAHEFCVFRLEHSSDASVYQSVLTRTLRLDKLRSSEVKDYLLKIFRRDLPDAGLDFKAEWDKAFAELNVEKEQLRVALEQHKELAELEDLHTQRLLLRGRILCWQPLIDKGVEQWHESYKLRNSELISKKAACQETISQHNKQIVDNTKQKTQAEQKLLELQNESKELSELQRRFELIQDEQVLHDRRKELQDKRDDLKRQEGNVQQRDLASMRRELKRCQEELVNVGNDIENQGATLYQKLTESISAELLVALNKTLAKPIFSLGSKSFELDAHALTQALGGSNDGRLQLPGLTLQLEELNEQYQQLSLVELQKEQQDLQRKQTDLEKMIQAAQAMEQLRDKITKLEADLEKVRCEILAYQRMKDLLVQEPQRKLEIAALQEQITQAAEWLEKADEVYRQLTEQDSGLAEKLANLERDNTEIQRLTGARIDHGPPFTWLAELPHTRWLGQSELVVEQLAANLKKFVDDCRSLNAQDSGVQNLLGSLHAKGLTRYQHLSSEEEEVSKLIEFSHNLEHEAEALEKKARTAVVNVSASLRELRSGLNNIKAGMRRFNKKISGRRLSDLEVFRVDVEDEEQLVEAIECLMSTAESVDTGESFELFNQESLMDDDKLDRAKTLLIEEGNARGGLRVADLFRLRFKIGKEGREPEAFDDLDSAASNGTVLMAKLVTGLAMLNLMQDPRRPVQGVCYLDEALALDAKNQRSLIETASEFGFSLIFASPAPLTTARYCVPIVQREGMNLIGRSGWQVLEQLEA